MAQDPEREEENREERSIDPSHELDMVSLYCSTTVDAEIEADVIRGILDSNGIPSLVVRAAGFPPLGFEVQVPRAQAKEAERLIEAAKAAGPEAAAEAERGTEGD
ncbi:MAG TPA: hypothetical protein VLY04_23220 [Bryobacteraceae bacterium]|nr:hypothetical protein [Bryobacteraceae bacterium]